VKNVTAAIIESGGLYLLARRGPGESLAGLWEFPGGKVEEGETFEECVVRELLEELSIDVRVLEHFCDSIYRYESGAIKLVAYRVEILGGKMALSVHDLIDWFSPVEMLSLKLAPADIPIAERLAACPH